MTDINDKVKKLKKKVAIFDDEIGDIIDRQDRHGAMIHQMVSANNIVVRQLEEAKRRIDVLFAANGLVVSTQPATGYDAVDLREVKSMTMVDTGNLEAFAELADAIGGIVFAHPVDGPIGMWVQVYSDDDEAFLARATHGSYVTVLNDGDTIVLPHDAYAVWQSYVQSQEEGPTPPPEETAADGHGS